MKKIIAPLAITSALMLGVASQATASAAAAPEPIDTLAITQIGYNAVGADVWGNRNAEYVDIEASADTDVTGLLVQDAWRKATRSHYKPTCNTFTVKVANVDASLVSGDKVTLPANHTLRVYSGTGTPAPFAGGAFHSAYVDSRCGYNGHFLNNDRDAAWITLGQKAEWKGYDFRQGYYAR